MLYLDKELHVYFSSAKPLFDQIMALNGDVFRKQKGRLTQRITLGNKHYFLKRHQGVGIKEIIKNLIMLRAPVISAKNEWQAIQKLETLAIKAPKIVGYGERGINPAAKESFVLMEELAPVISLEDFCRDWQKAPPQVKLKWRLLNEVARIAAQLHQHGMNHRDFYICHFLLDTSVPLQEKLHLYLIDLHRAQLRHLTPKRWIIKDLSGLYFSSKDIGLTKRDLLRFMKAYHQKPLRAICAAHTDFWEQVKKRGEQLYRDHR